jgi:hypothetical protein
MNSGELFGFRYKWLEPSMANEEIYQDGDLFVRIAQDIARVLVEALPDSYCLKTLESPKIKPMRSALIKCWGNSEHQESIEALLSEAADLLEDAIMDRTRDNIEKAWEKLSCARALANKATGIDPNGLPPNGDVAAVLGRAGGKSRTARIRQVQEKLCRSISMFLQEKKVWDGSNNLPAIRNVNSMIYDAMMRGFEKDETWYYLDKAKWGFYQLGMASIDRCVTASKRRYERSKQY